MNKINRCPDSGEFKEYLNGDLLEQQIIDFENHIEECKLCAEAVEGYKLAFKQGEINANANVKTEKPKFHLRRRLLPYAAAVTLLAGLVLSQTIKNWRFKNEFADNSEILIANHKTLSHKSDADYWYIGSEKQIAFNDQFVLPSQLTEVSKQSNEVGQVFIQVEEANKEKAEEFVAAIKSNQTVPVYTYSKHWGLKKN